MNQSKREKKNKFKCFVCDELNLRGVAVRLKPMPYEVKICRNPKCLSFVKKTKLERAFLYSP